MNATDQRTFSVSLTLPEPGIRNKIPSTDIRLSMLMKPVDQVITYTHITCVADAWLIVHHNIVMLT